MIWVDEFMTKRVFFRLPRFERWEGRLRLRVQREGTQMLPMYMGDIQAQVKDS